MTDDELRALAARLAPLVAEQLGPLLGQSSVPRYADKDDNPYGRQRAFLDAARRKDFATFRLCRRVTALWADVERAIETSGKRTPAAVEAPPLTMDYLDELLDGKGSRRQKSKAA